MLPQPPLWLVLIAFVCALGPLVFFHELGHYLVARLFGIPAEAFSIGFGRALVGWTDRRGTRWKVGWLPLGGYVKFVGDMSPASEPGDLDGVPEHLRDRIFQVRPVWQRFLVVLAGPTANFLLAILIFAGFFSLIGTPLTNAVGRRRAEVAGCGCRHSAGGPDRLGGRARDTDLQRRVQRGAGPSQRNCARRNRARRRHPGAQHSPGLRDAERRHRPNDAWRRAWHPLEPAGRKAGLDLPRGADGGRLHSSADPSDRRWRGPAGEGPGVDQATRRTDHDRPGRRTGRRARHIAVRQLLALLSINLGFINLLPVPMLDGGHLFFYAVEAVRRRPLSARSLDFAFRGGLALILALVVFTTINDLGSLGLWDRLQRLIG